MKYEVSSKGFKLSDATLQQIEKYVVKVERILPHFAPDLVFVDIVLKKHKIHRLNHIKDYEPEENEIIVGHVNPKAKSSVYFDGIIKLILPKKPLIVHLKGSMIDESIHAGFDRLIKEIETYKGKHFSGDSKYYDHRTIRKIR